MGRIHEPTGGCKRPCTLALLNAGVEAGDPQMQKALAYLRKFKPEKTYVTSLQTMVFARAEPQNDLLLISRNVRWLESMQILDGPRKGPGPIRKGSGDNSNSQFALLALSEAEHAGVQVSDQTWPGPHILGRLPEPGRLLGILQTRARHWKHDLCGHSVAGDHGR